MLLMHNELLLINLAAVSVEQQKYAKIGHFCCIIRTFLPNQRISGKTKFNIRAYF